MYIFNKHVPLDRKTEARAATVNVSCNVPLAKQNLALASDLATKSIITPLRFELDNALPAKW